MARYDVDALDNRTPEAVARYLRLIEAVVMRWHPHRVTGLEHIPKGPALFVGNHNAGLWTPDSYLLYQALYRAGGIDALPYGLAHEVILRNSPFNEILCPVGVVRAHRDNALRIFARGDKALVYPGGDLDGMRPFRRRNEVVFGNRRGYIRLALEAGVPIVPVVSAGAHAIYIVLDDLQGLANTLRLDRFFRLKVMPLTLSFPLGLTLGPLFPFIPWPTRILVEVGEPITFARTGPEAAADEAYVAACAAEVQGRMQAALTRLADERRMGAR